jgi:ABC-2 type transport system permease protein
MRGALRYEWIRITTIRSTYWLSAFAVLLGVGLSFVAAMGASFAFGSSHPPTVGDLGPFDKGVVTQFAAFGAPYFVVYLLAMVSVFAWGHEYRHGMVRATLTALSSRTASWAAKFVVVGVWVAAVTTLVTLGSGAVGWLWLHDDDLDMFNGGTWALMAWTVVYAVLFSWVAAGCTALLRNQTATLVLLFVWPLAIENVVKLVFQVVPTLRPHAGFTRFLPFDAGGRIIDTTGSAHSVFGNPLPLLGGLVVFGGLAVAVMVASLVLFKRRDA